MWKAVVQRWRRFASAGILIAGALAYILALIPIVRHRHSSFPHQFYSYATSLAVADLLGIVWRVFMINFEEVFELSSAVSMLHGFLGNWIWYSVELHQVCIVVDRFLAVVFPLSTITIKLKDWKTVCIALAFVWLGSLALNLPILFDSRLVYIHIGEGNTFYNLTNNPTAAHFNQIRDLTIHTGILVGIVSMYAVTGLRVKVLKRKVQRSSQGTRPALDRAEVRLVLQGFLVAMPQLVVTLLTHLLVYLPQLPVDLSFLLRGLKLLLIDVMFTLNPFVYFAFNSELRRMALASDTNRRTNQQLVNL